MTTVNKSEPKVSVVPWGDIRNPDAPRRWGLKVGNAYVSRGGQALFFDTKSEAQGEASRLRERVQTAKEGAGG